MITINMKCKDVSRNTPVIKHVDFKPISPDESYCHLSIWADEIPGLTQLEVDKDYKINITIEPLN